MESLNIALIHEQRSAYLDTNPGHSEEHCAALPHDGEVQAVESTLKALGHNVTLVPGIEALVAQLADNQHATWDLAFNMAQGFYGSTRESQVPALLEAYRIPYTFSDAATMASCQNKATSKVCLPPNTLHPPPNTHPNPLPQGNRLIMVDHPSPPRYPNSPIPGRLDKRNRRQRDPPRPLIVVSALIPSLPKTHNRRII